MYIFDVYICIYRHTYIRIATHTYVYIYSVYMYILKRNIPIRMIHHHSSWGSWVFALSVPPRLRGWAVVRGPSEPAERPPRGKRLDGATGTGGGQLP